MNQERDSEIDINAQEVAASSGESRLLTLARESFGFRENEEMVSLRKEINGLSKEDEDFEEEFKRLFTQYSDLAYEEIDKNHDSYQHPEAPIGYSLVTAGFFHQFDKFNDYHDQMWGAIEYAHELGLEELSERISEERLAIFGDDFSQRLKEADLSDLNYWSFEELRDSEKEVAERVLLEELDRKSDPETQFELDNLLQHLKGI